VVLITSKFNTTVTPIVPNLDTLTLSNQIVAQFKSYDSPVVLELQSFYTFAELGLVDVALQYLSYDPADPTHPTSMCMLAVVLIYICVCESKREREREREREEEQGKKEMCKTHSFQCWDECVIGRSNFVCMCSDHCQVRFE
jgi:hypothetical protein